MQTVPTFNLNYLSAEQSWQVFHHYAFGGAIQNMGSNLIEIGKQIMRKCEMLPLAIKSIASLLRHEPNEESWKGILQNELWESDTNDEIFRSLQISYARLPTYLKPCFLYCSMFPKDYRYNIKKLVKLWISQGYVQKDGLRSAHEIGWEYAKGLWQRSFFQGNYREKNFYCTLHDMVHDLARFNSGHGCYSIVGGMDPNFPKELYHLYVRGGFNLIETPSYPFGMFATLRTPIVDNNWSKQSWSAFDISKAPKLRVLDLSCRNDLHFDFSFVKSKHLRYLCIDGICFERLPECICSLYNLQKLTLRHCFDLIELPKSIGNLVSLEELTIKSCDLLRVLPVSLGQLKALRKFRLRECSELEEVSFDMGNLTNLQLLTISETSVSSVPPSMYRILTRIGALELRLKCSTMGWLEHLINLEGTLILTGLNCVRSLNDVRRANLASMHNLHRLILWWDHSFHDRYRIAYQNVLELFIDRNRDASPETDTNEDEYEINDYSLMVWLQPHPNCKELEIKCYYNCLFPLWIGNPILCASLERIALNCCLYITFIPFGNLGKLKCLRIFGCSSLQFIQEESLPLVLEEIEISCCRSLISVMGLRRLKFLFKLRITECKNLVLLDPCRKASITTFVWQCPKLQEWCSQHDISYEGKSCEVDLKVLNIESYSGLLIPDWIGDPTICASLERIEVLDCLYITFIPFGSLEKLKYLRILGCSSLEFINEDSLPLVVEEIEISDCENLTYVNGMQMLKSLVKLDITDCRNLCWLDPFGKTSIITISKCPKIRELCAQHDIYYKGSESDNSSGSAPSDGDEYHSHDIHNDKNGDDTGSDWR
ncbi:hypothetical protein LUZ63_013526 [Rhynchospora breviuscula]|uniref:NB-ARC domain-containing protein n=1 Tax=Rhynchospora breviuscula TaxID=2022672 RepID=A0A9Q0C8Q3_9POAL|nr:hypothetical protein LUZ63_013526 [Rhynchospora breviuscula]